MSNPLIGALSFAIFPAIAVVAGAVMALLREPGPTMRSAIQHFAAGVIFCVLATELLPDLLHRRMPLMTVIGFSIGVAAMLGLKYFSERVSQTAATSSIFPSSFMVAMGIDMTLDGLLIGLSSAAGQKQGMLLTFALVLEVVFLGVSCATSLRSGGASRFGIIRATAILGALLLFGAGSGAIASTILTATMLDALLAFGVAALLYLVTEELLVEAHEVPESPAQTAMFFVGFIVLFALDMLI